MDNTQLESILRSKIIEAISILELRVSLNAQTIRPPERGHNHESTGTSSSATQIKVQNKRAQNAIEESIEAIHKLEFINGCIPDYATKSLYELFSNYNSYSLEELKSEAFKFPLVKKTTQTVQSGG